MSDNAEVVDALASWLKGAVPLEARPCAVLAHALLCRKELKIKRGAINQLLKSLNLGDQFGQVRESLVTCGLLRKISGQNGSTVYAIDLDVAGITLPEPVQMEMPAVSDGEPEGPSDAAGETTDAEVISVEPVAEPESETPDAATPAKERTVSAKPAKSARAAQEGSTASDSKKKEAAAPAGKKKQKKARRQEGPKAPRAVEVREKPVAEKRGVLGLLSAGRTIGASLLRRDQGVPATPKSVEKQGKDGDRRPSQQDDFERLRAWIAEHDGEQLPYVTRRQRAYQIFDDEKALEGKRGDRLMRRMAAKGINPGALRISSNQTPPLQGFYAIGANQPFIVVENIDAYEEIVALLKTKRNAKLFGEKVGGVIFGAGHNICQAHALDDYLHDIGYGFDYVYYAGDVDREGARLVEKAREVNVIEIRLHAGVYRAMFEAHKAHVQGGSSSESAAKNQDIPRNLVEILKGLPWSLRVPFKRALRDNIRIPQEVLTSEDFRRGSLGSVDKLLDR